jgi:hypothetical protein
MKTKILNRLRSCIPNKGKIRTNIMVLEFDWIKYHEQRKLVNQVSEPTKFYLPQVNKKAV